MSNQISYIIPSRLPTEKAYGFQILKTCSSLSHEKNISNINIIYPKRKNFIKEKPFDYYDLKINEKIKLLELGDHDIFEKFKLFGEKFSFKLHILSFLLKIIKIRNKLSNNIIILRDFNLIFFFILFKPFLKCKAIFYESHEKIYLNIINRFLLKKLDLILPISNNLFEYYKEINPNIEITNSITDKNKINKKYLLKNKFIKRINLNNEQLRIGIIGHSTTLGIDKGNKKLFDHLINIPNFNFFFVGLDDFNFESFRNSINKNSIKNIFIFKKIKFKNIYKFYDICDSFIIYYPNFDYFNNSSPVKIFECLATGKPIICNDNVSILSILEKDKNCIVFDSNFDDFESKLLALHNEKIRNKISEFNRVSFKKYSIENKIELLNNLIKKYANS